MQLCYYPVTSIVLTNSLLSSLKSICINFNLTSYNNAKSITTTNTSLFLNEAIKSSVNNSVFKNSIHSFIENLIKMSTKADIENKKNRMTVLTNDTTLNEKINCIFLQILVAMSYAEETTNNGIERKIFVVEDLVNAEKKIALTFFEKIHHLIIKKNKCSLLENFLQKSLTTLIFFKSRKYCFLVA